jgi:hypothetical protein
MMETKTLEICGSCKLEAETYEDGNSYVTLEYAEYSSDHYHSDSVTEIEINKKEGAEIVAFLTEHLGL